jgi:hypothetical protein
MVKFAKRWNAIVFAVAVCTAGSPMANAESDLPPERVQGVVSFRSGGIGTDQQDAMKLAAASYPLELQFVERGQTLVCLKGCMRLMSASRFGTAAVVSCLRQRQPAPSCWPDSPMATIRSAQTTTDAWRQSACASSRPSIKRSCSNGMLDEGARNRGADTLPFGCNARRRSAF